MNLKRALVVSVAPVMVLAAGAPASASVNAVAVDIATGDVTATCSFAPALIVGSNGGVKVAVDGTATSGSPVNTLATNLNCVVKTNFGNWGGASLGLPGPAAAAAGVSNEIPLAKIAGLRVCAYGTAFVQGGGTIASDPSPGC